MTGKSGGSEGDSLFSFKINDNLKRDDQGIWNKITAIVYKVQWNIQGSSNNSVMNKKSRMKGDFQVRFRGNVGVKFPCVTRRVPWINKNRTVLWECCIWDGRLLRVLKPSVEVERTDWLTKDNKTKRETFRRRLSGVVFKPPYAAALGNWSSGER